MSLDFFMTTPFFEKHKSNPKIKKIILETENKVKKKQSSIEQKIKSETQKSVSAITTRQEKKLANYTKLSRTKAEKRARKELGVKLTKKQQSLDVKWYKYRRDRACTAVQLNGRIIRADKWGYVIQQCSGKRVHYTECDGGHLYPKSSFKGLAFDPRNIRPISKGKNQVQWTSIGDWHEEVRLQLKEEAYATKRKKRATAELEEKALYFEAENKKIIDNFI